MEGWLAGEMFFEAMVFVGDIGLGKQHRRAFWADEAQVAGNGGLLKIRRGKRRVAVGADNANHGSLLLFGTVILYSNQQEAILYAKHISGNHCVWPTDI